MRDINPEVQRDMLLYGTGIQDADGNRIDPRSFYIMPSDLERLARCLHRASYEVGRGIAPPWPADRFDQERWLCMVRALLQELREPSQGMIEAGLDCPTAFEIADDGTIFRPCSAFAAMIDSILAEGAEKHRHD